MTVRELYSALEERIPRELSCSWDNDGLMCCPDEQREVRRVLITLDVTEAMAEVAINGGYDVIISHHPFIFHGIKALNGTSTVSRKAIELLKNGVAVMSFHTRLDAVRGGVNDILCGLIGLSDVSELLVDGLPLGRIGTLDRELDAKTLAENLKKAINAPFVLLADAGVKSHRVALVGGGGGDFLSAARAAGADTYISGRVGYHEMTDAPDEASNRMNVIEAGHFYTEFPVCDAILDMINEIDGNIECDICNSNIIKAI